jgi:hypothetical protein
MLIKVKVLERLIYVYSRRWSNRSNDALLEVNFEQSERYTNFRMKYDKRVALAKVTSETK